METKIKIDNLYNCLSKIIDYRGKTPKKLGFKWSKKGFRAISAKNVKFNGLINLNSIKYVDSESYKKWMKEEIKKGDLLLTSEAPSGQVMLWDSDEKIVLSQRLFCLRTKENVDSTYLKYFLQSDIGQREIINKNSGSTVSGISVKTLNIIQVLLPDIDKQASIGKILYGLDKKIELNNRINAELESISKLIYDYWFIQFDFPNKNGKPYKSSGGKMIYSKKLKRNIPQGWEVELLGNMLKVQKGISYKSSEIKTTNGVPMINLNSFNLNGTYKGNGIKYFTGKIPDLKIAMPNDLLIASTDVTRNADIIGKAILVPNYYTGKITYSMDIFKIIPDDGNLKLYLMMLFNSKHYHDYIKWFASGTIVLHLNDDGIKWYPLEKPTPELIKKWNEFYSPISERIYETQKQNKELSELRDFLLPMLMNEQVKMK